MIGPIHVGGESSREWKIIQMTAFAKFYIEELGNVVGGSLHIVLSDGNVGLGHVEFCLIEAEKKEDWVGVALAKVLLELTESEIQQVYDSL